MIAGTWCVWVRISVLREGLAVSSWGPSACRRKDRGE